VNESTAMQQDPGASAFRMIRTLGLIATFAGLTVVLVYQWTLPLIAENQRVAIERAVFQVVPGATRRVDFVLGEQGLARAGTEGASGEVVYAAYDDSGELKGVAVEGAAQGYQDVIRLLYGYEPACHCIRGIKILKMTETPGLGDKIAKDPDFLANFEALAVKLGAGGGLAEPITTVKHGTKRNPWEIDAISGATVSSVAVGKALNASMQRMAPLIERYLAEIRAGGER
jgi:electron transport complex protein RnfG